MAALLLAGTGMAASAPPATAGMSSSAPPAAAPWVDRLTVDLLRIEIEEGRRFGVWVHDPASGATLAWRADERWYLASMVKLPVAIAVLRAVEAGAFDLETQLTLRAADIVDGAGRTNFQPIGAQLPVGWLLEQMIVDSDNTASDMLIGLVGLDAVNQVAQELAQVPGPAAVALAGSTRAAQPARARDPSRRPVVLPLAPAGPSGDPRRAPPPAPADSASSPTVAQALVTMTHTPINNPAIGRITSLADVRRLTYGQLTPSAMRLGGRDFLMLRREPDDAARVRKLGELLQESPAGFRLASLESAYEAYYASGLNAGRLDAFGGLVTALLQGRALGPWGTRHLLEVMDRTRSGAARLRSGLPASARLAHKTGTQRGRTCDAGVVTPERAHRQVVLVACVSGTSTARAEGVLRQVGLAVGRSGLLSPDRLP